MVSPRATLSPLLRSLAAGTLLCWLAAWVACSVECFGGGAPCQPNHHAEQAAAAQHDHEQAPDSDRHGDCPNSVCDSLKTLVPAAHANILPKPDFAFVTLAFASLPQLMASAEQETLIRCQPPDREFVFTPEVCLGPAFRSLAPPILL